MFRTALGHTALALICCLATPLLAAGPRQSAAPPSPVDPAIVRAALAASDDAAREALVARYPEIGTDPTRRAIIAAADERTRSGYLPDAVNAHRTLLLAATRLSDARARRIAILGIGQVAGRGGDLVTAAPALAEALRLSEAAGDMETIISAANGLGIVLRQQGKYDDAIASLQRSLTAAEQTGRRDAVARALNNLGIVAELQGDLRTALAYHMRSLAIKEELKLVADMASSLVNIGSVHYRQRNFQRAIEYWERALVAAEQTGNRNSLLVALSNIGNAHAIEGRYDAARQVLDRALPIAEAASNRNMTAGVHYNIGLVHAREHRLTEAGAAYRRSLEIREASGDTPGATEALVALAELALASGNAAEALSYAQRGAALARRIGLLHELWNAVEFIGNAEQQLGRPDAAIAAYTEAIAVIEQMRQQVAGGAPDLQRYFTNKLGPYYELSALEASRGRMDEALATAERARARVLVDILAAGRPIVTTLSPAERAREQELNRRLAEANDRRDTAQRSSAETVETVARLERELDAARKAREQWQFDTYALHPDLRFGRGEAPLASLTTIAAALPPDTTALVFMAGESNTRLLTLTRGATPTRPAMRVITLPVSRADLTRRVAAFTRRIASRDLGFAPEAAALYTLLLTPVAAELGTSRQLVIVPDGPLWQLPFQALRTPRGRFLIEERPLSYAHSLSALVHLDDRRRARAGRAETLVALGDPAQPANDARLPEAAREVRALAEMYGGASRAFIGADATEARFRDAAHASTVHVATHGELDPSSPMYSFVALGRGEGSETADGDGRLEAWEIANLTLTADLVVLSACETALGADGMGEGIVGLSWALFAAGAATTVVSQWRVDSASTTELMLNFHRARRTAVNRFPARAMQVAARAMLATSRYRHPFYWSGFVVIGAP